MLLRHPRFLLAVTGLATLSGCNLIFGIEEGTLGEGTGGGSTATTTGTGGSTTITTTGSGGASGSGGATTTTTTSGSGGDGGGGGTPTIECDPAANPAQGIDDTCGVFVDTGSSTTTPNGSQANPYTSLDAALSAGNGNRRIYICGSPTTVLINPIDLNGGSLLGGLNCGTWTHTVGIHPIILGPSGAPAIVANQNVTPTRLFSIHVNAGQASTTPPGQPSVGVVSQGATLVIEDSTVQGARGGQGADSPDMTVAAMNGNNAPTGTCSNSGQPASGMCNGFDVGGGKGGSAVISCDAAGHNGDNGKGPSNSVNRGIFDASTGACTNATQGINGQDGAAGPGGSGIGSLTMAGWAPPTSVDGGVGEPGDGGGGGGGRVNGTGGGGGSGGCAGAGGRQGGYGGPSLAIVQAGGSLTLINSAILGGEGGRGGQGGKGQPPGVGGTGAASGNGSCSGGNGGLGGRGGPGGGGDGGASALVARISALGGNFTADAATVTASMTGTPGGPGNGAVDGSVTAPAGSPGLSCAVLVFNGTSGGMCLPL